MPGSKQVPSHHSYPFNRLPTLILHMKLYFIICDAGQKLAYILQSVMPPIMSLIYGINKISAKNMLNIALDSYILWGSQQPLPRFALSLHMPPHMPIMTMASATSIFYNGPCFYNRYKQSVHYCSYCIPSSHYCHFRLVSSTNLDTCNEFLSYDGTNGGEGSLQHERYHKNVVHHVGKWLVLYMAQIKK